MSTCQGMATLPKRIRSVYTSVRLRSAYTVPIHRHPFPYTLCSCTDSLYANILIISFSLKALTIDLIVKEIVQKCANMHFYSHVLELCIHTERYPYPKHVNSSPSLESTYDDIKTPVARARPSYCFLLNKALKTSSKGVFPQHL